MRTPPLLLLLLAFAAPLLNAQTPGKSTAKKPASTETPTSTSATIPTAVKIVPVVLKLDDVRTNDSGHLSERWTRLGTLAKERKIKLSLGVIANSLEGNKPAYFAWLKEMHDTGLVEFWFHGYDHATRDVGDKQAIEFTSRTYEEQKERFDKSQKLAKEKLGFTFETFGPPGGGNIPPSDADLDAICRVMTDDPYMKVWLYNSPIDARGEKLNAAGKITVLDRVWAVNIEQPLFVPNSEKFIAGYNKNAAKRQYFICQGHAGKWDEPRWAEFLKIVDFLTTNKIPTVTPTELAALLKKSTPSAKSTP